MSLSLAQNLLKCSNFGRFIQSRNYSLLTPRNNTTIGTVKNVFNTEQTWSPFNNVSRRFLRQPRSRKTSLAPKVEVVPKHGISARLLIKPLGFTAMISGSSFVGAMIWQYESMRNEAIKAVKAFSDGVRTRMNKEGDLRQILNAHWNSLSPGNKVAAALIAMNIGVFLMWRIPALEPLMVRFFCSNPASGAPCWSMFLSTFSHYSFFHLAVNMYVLWSFSNIIGQVLGKEQFMGVYLSAGVVSSLFSYAAKTIRPSLVPSLGASGAIMAILGATCISFPESRLSIAFIGDIYPHSFSADSAMKFLIAFDTIGLLLGWKYFDHAAHLGGILFGMWYMKYGNKYIWRKREKLVKHWHELRGKPR